MKKLVMLSLSLLVLNAFGTHKMRLEVALEAEKLMLVGTMEPNVLVWGTEREDYLVTIQPQNEVSRAEDFCFVVRIYTCDRLGCVQEVAMLDKVLLAGNTRVTLTAKAKQEGARDFTVAIDVNEEAGLSDESEQQQDAQ